ncbi:PEGA domain-containing protein [Elizabethkingia argentiflava]|uniref:PEGA domain-containing protein n=1 Tax=Elizabethkingia argenteiflava TaxID=2681556 RepID=A0A845PSZ8_9FLAO|nr:PEGA domain-containing protein [Elizabethkingia argenteiflava]NAW50161.1 PEGA domain-containing protein [Elizabethkingia argenteiflava]
MKKISTIFIMSVLTFSVTSCATIFTGTTDSLTVTTKPEGAKVYDRGVEKCTTPCSFKVSRSLTDRSVEIKKEGYETKAIGLDRKFNPVSIINLFGLIGWAVDAATGSLMKYDTKGYNVELTEKKK